MEALSQLSYSPKTVVFEAKKILIYSSFIVNFFQKVFKFERHL